MRARALQARGELSPLRRAPPIGLRWSGGRGGRDAMRRDERIARIEPVPN
jgi:hypothetical protein